MRNSVPGLRRIYTDKIIAIYDNPESVIFHMWVPEISNLQHAFLESKNACFTYKNRFTHENLQYALSLLGEHCAYDHIYELMIDEEDRLYSSK